MPLYEDKQGIFLHLIVLFIVNDHGLQGLSGGFKMYIMLVRKLYSPCSYVIQEGFHIRPDKGHAFVFPIFLAVYIRFFRALHLIHILRSQLKEFV